jgi:uncharacterized repeat protein (TIGR01451 family)
MRPQIPYPSSTTFRVFTSGLLSFLLLMSPMATPLGALAAPSSRAGEDAKPPAAPAQGVDAREPSAASPLAPVFVAPVTADLTDNVTPNTTKVDKGAAINYTATITVGASAVNGVEFQDTPDSNTTLVGGSIHASPVANDDVYNWVGNTVLDTSARGLASITGNDTAPTDTFTLNTTPTSGPSHGSVTISSNGHFVYTPTASYSGDDQFTYTISNNADATLTSTGTVTIHMPFRVWYVQNAASNGDGRSNNPFNSPSSASSAATAPTDVIYIFSDTANSKLNGLFSLDNGQALLGQGVALVVNPNNTGNITLFSAGSAPTITDSSGNGVTLAQNNTLAGFIVGDTSAIDIANTTTSSVGTLNISSVTLNGTGGLFRADSGGTLNVTFDAASTTSAPGNAIQLNSVTGSFTVNGSGSITGVTGTGVLISGGNATVSIASSINKNSSGRIADIQSRTGNNVTLSGQLDCSSGCTGINVSSNTGGTIDFSNGTKNISTGSNTAVTLATNTGTTINFSNGGLNIDTTSGNGFDASGGGTINVTTGTNNNTIDSTTGTAFNAANVTFGASGATFKSISSNGGVHGILLDTTTGNFTVAGDGTGHANGSGGAIQNITVGNTANPADPANLTDEPVYLKKVNGTITLKSINMSLNASGTNSSGYAGMYVDSNTGGTATVNITGCTFTGRATSAGANNTQNKALLQFEGGNTGGSAANVTGNVQDCFFNGGRTYGFFAEAAGDATVNVTVNQSGFGTDVVTGAAVNNPGTTMTNPTPIYFGISNGGNGKIDYAITNSTFWGADGINGAPHGIAITGAGTSASSHTNGTISGNHLGKTGVTGSGCASGCAGIGILPGLQGTYTTTITNNDIRQTNSIGINIANTIAAGATFTLNLHIKGNTLAEPDTTGSPAFQRAIAILPGNSGGANVTVCAEIGGSVAGDKNTISGAWQTSNFIRLSNLNNTGTMTLQGLSPTTGATAAQVNSYLEGNNSFPGSANTTSTCSAGTGCDVNSTPPINGGASCPLFLGLGGVTPSSSGSFTYFDTLDLSQVLAANEAPAALTNNFSNAPNAVEATASASAPTSSVTTSLDQRQLDSIVAAAVQRWEATGLTDEQVASLRAVRFEISDLSNAYLGEADAGRVLIDRDAEGRGWFVDPNPLADESFAHPLSATMLYADPSGAPAGHVDLLTAIEHELGHHLRLADTYSAAERDNLMYGYLTVGERRLPARGQAAGAEANAASGPHFLSLSGEDALPKVSNSHAAPARRTNASAGRGSKGRALSSAAAPAAFFVSPVDVTFGTLPAGKVVKVKFSVTVNNSLSPANTTQVQTQGSVLVTGFAATPTNDPDTGTAGDATVTLISRKDLALTSVTDNNTTTTPGSTLNYDIHYSNPGHAATNVVITETVPEGTTYDSATTPGWTCTPNNNAGSTCTNSIGSLAAGAPDAKVNFAVKVNNPAASHLETISDTASIDDDHTYEADFDTTNNSASDTTTLNAEPAFGTFTKTDGNTTTTPGSTLTYTISYANTGNQDAVNVVLTETVPAGTTYVASGSSAWSCADNSPALTACTINISSLAAGAAASSAIFKVTVNSPAGAGLDNIVNNASIADDGSNTTGSSTPKTASAQDSDTLNAAPDLFVGKTPDVSTAGPGQTITYTVNYANNGNQGATGVKVTETVPANTTFVASGSSTWTNCSDGAAANTVCTYTVGALAVGGNGSLTFKVKVNNSVPGGTTQITNVATIDDDHNNGPDSNTGNNTTGPVTTQVCTNPVTVTTTADGGAGSLRQALLDVCPNGTVNFNLPDDSIIKLSSELAITQGVSIVGPDNRLTISGEGTTRVFNVSAGTVNISNLTVSGGKVTGSNGAGLLVSGGTVTLTGMLFTGNTAVSGGGAVASSGGTLNVYNSTIDTNTATNGGGVYHDTAGTVALVNDTITSNTANGDVGSGPVVGGGDSGGVMSLGGTTTTAKNTIIALNSAGTNADQSGVTNSGNNVIGTDPQVGSLANNGGPTKTRALALTSPAVDAGDNAAATAAGLTTDQRGTNFPRVADSADADATATVDIGAFELHPSVEDIPDKSTNEDTTLNVTFQVGDGSLLTSVAGTSSNQTLVPDASITVDGTGSTRTIHITPAANANSAADGTATITVTVTATNGRTATDTFVLTVTSVDDGPTLTNDTGATVNEGSTGNAITSSMLRADDVDNDATQLVFTVGTATAHGTLKKGGSALSSGGTFTQADINNGLVTYDHDGGETTSDGFTFTVSDGAGGSIGSTAFNITVTPVNDAPAVTAGGTLSYTENDAATPIDGTITVNDVDSPNLASATAQITGNYQNGQDVLSFANTGTITGSFDSATGKLTLTGGDTPANYQAALQSVKYQNNSDNPSTSARTVSWTVNDGSANSNTATSTINITAVNDAPVNTVPGAQSTNEDTAKVFSSAGGDQISVADADAGSNAVKVTLTATNGTLTLSGTSGLSFSAGDGTADATMTFTGTVANVNAALDGMSFNPTANYHGAASVQIVTDDQGNAGTGGAKTDTDSVSITVNPVADTPSVTSATTFVNTQTSTSDLVVTVNAADGAEVQFFKITNPQHGTVFKHDGTTQINDGDFITVAEGNAGLRFTPATDYTGAASFDVQGSIDNAGTGLSAAATASITVNKFDSTTTITSDTPDESVVGQAVTVAYTVAGVSPANTTPTGNVVVTVSGGSETCTGTVAAGQCQITLTGTGSRTLTATYAGDARFNGSSDDESHSVVVRPTLQVLDAQAAEPSSGTLKMLFTVVLQNPPASQDVTVDYATADDTGGSHPATSGTCGSGGADYESASGTLTFNHTTGETVKTIAVTICSDAAAEPDETFLLNLSNSPNGTIIRDQAKGTITQSNPAGTFIISELRTSGPGGLGDDFVELYNNTDAELTVQASDASAGYGVFKMGATCTDAPVLIATITNGTKIPARGHYLLVGSQYSLSTYAAGDQTLTSDIESDRNVAVFSTSDASNLSTVNRLDAVGFGSNVDNGPVSSDAPASTGKRLRASISTAEGPTPSGGVCDLFREGTNLPAANGSALEYSFFRWECDGTPTCGSGFPKDTNDNAADFLFADTQGTSTPMGQRLGAPGPENKNSPINRDTTALRMALLDANEAAAARPNRDRNPVPGASGVADFGTLSLRRRIQNNTGQDVTRLRFRIIAITTYPPASGNADLRAITSADVSVMHVHDTTTCVDRTAGTASDCTVTVKGTLLEGTPPGQKPQQPKGGGYNATLSVDLPGGKLPPNQSVEVQLQFGVEQPGLFRVLVITEALP